MQTSIREALLNALIHRDYTINQSIYVRFEPQQLKITSHGGFVEGVTLDNFITHEPKPRNRQLAEICQRIGLVERIGRGIDRIFIEQLRLGRLAPDYTSTDNETVRVILPGGESNLNFVKFVIENNILNVHELLILSTLQDQKELNLSEVSKLVQNTQVTTKKILCNLISKNFVKVISGKEYILSPWVYKQLKNLNEYIHLSGFDSIQQETMILQYIAENGSITRKNIEMLCHIPKVTAIRRIKKLIDEKKITIEGKGTSRKYK